MNWKALLAVVVVVSIVVLLYATETGKNYVSLLTNKVGNFIANFPFLGGQPGEKFFINLKSNKESFYGQTYEVENVSLHVSGICQGTMSIGNVVVSREEKSCSIEIENLKGRFEYIAGGIVRASGKAGFVSVDGYSYTSAEGELSMKLEVIPMDELLLSGLSQKSITLESATGNIERLSEEGAIKSFEELKDEKVTITNFVGYLRMEESSMLLKGMANSVKGETFSW